MVVLLGLIVTQHYPLRLSLEGELLKVYPHSMSGDTLGLKAAIKEEIYGNNGNMQTMT